MRHFTCLAACAMLCFHAPSTQLAGAEPPRPAPGFSVPVPSAEEMVGRIRRQHPRLLINTAGFEALKEKIATDPFLKKWDLKLRQDADRFLTARLPRHVMPDGLRLLDTSRRMVDHCYTLAMMYRLHGDRRYVDRLWQELETVAQFPDFNPRHFLDTAEMTHALAIAYDWLYDQWTEPERATIRKAIVDLGLKAGLKVYESKGGFPRFVHNWNQVCNGGMTIGALAVGDEEPALCGQILHHALASVQLAMRSYAPDGAWGEGPGYWAYATSYNVAMIACLESAAGSDCGLARFPGFDQTGLFPLYMTSGNRWFSFSDCSEHAGRSDCLLWLGHRFNLPAAEWLGAADKVTAAGMIWYSSPGKDPAAAGLPLDRYWPNVEVATMRSNWNDPQGLFLGIEARSHAFNHQHLDIGSFVLDALGQRWAVDLGSDDYNLHGYFGAGRYDYYRLRAEGHNTLVIDPAGGPDQDPQAECKISRWSSTPMRAFAVADLTRAYAKKARKVERGIAMIDRRYVIVQDEIGGAPTAAADIWWFMHTPAAVRLADDGRQAILTLNGKQLEARILAPNSARFEIRPAEPLPTSPHPAGQKRNEGIRKLAIHLPDTKSARVTVALVPRDGQGQVELPKASPLAEW
jgi:hypothetical protein